MTAIKTIRREVGDEERKETLNAQSVCIDGYLDESNYKSLQEEEGLDYFLESKEFVFSAWKEPEGPGLVVVRGTTLADVTFVPYHANGDQGPLGQPICLDGHALCYESKALVLDRIIQRVAGFIEQDIYLVNAEDPVLQAYIGAGGLARSGFGLFGRGLNLESLEFLLRNLHDAGMDVNNPLFEVLTSVVSQVRILEGGCESTQGPEGGRP